MQSGVFHNHLPPCGHCVSGQCYLFYYVFLNFNFICQCVTLSSYYSNAAVTVQSSTAAHPLLHLFLLCQSCHSVALAADSLSAYCAENRRSALAQVVRAKYLELKLFVAQRLIVQYLALRRSCFQTQRGSTIEVEFAYFFACLNRFLVDGLVSLLSLTVGSRCIHF